MTMQACCPFISVRCSASRWLWLSSWQDRVVIRFPLRVTRESQMSKMDQIKVARVSFGRLCATGNAVQVHETPTSGWFVLFAAAAAAALAE